MKLGFRTLGMPAWPGERFAAVAAELGYDGVELAGSRRLPTPEGYELPLELTEEEIRRLRSAFDSAGVEFPTLLCYNVPVHVDGRADWTRYEEDVAFHARLAVRLGVRRIRLTVDTPPELDRWEAALDRAWHAIATGLEAGPQLGAIVQNHPGIASAGQLLATAERYGDPRIGVVYSPDHAFTMQEDVLGLVDRFAPWIHEVSFADRRIVREGLADFDGRYYTVRYESCVVGEGDVPLPALVERLAAVGFDDYICLKWEKSPRYGQHLPDGEAVLPGYVRYMRSLLS